MKRVLTQYKEPFTLKGPILIVLGEKCFGQVGHMVFNH